MSVYWEQVAEPNSFPQFDMAADEKLTATACSCSSESLSSAAGELLVLRVAGEVDLLTVAVLQAALDHHLDRRPADVVLDLARLRFCSARGMSLLARAGATAAEREIGYVIGGMPPSVARIWEKLWPDAVATRYPSAAVAVTAVRAAHALRPN